MALPAASLVAMALPAVSLADTAQAVRPVMEALVEEDRRAV